MSLSSSSSHFSSSENEEEEQETKRFHIVSNKDPFKWDLSCGNIQFKKYIPEKSLHDLICEVHLVPNNLNQVKKMDEFLKDILKEKNKNNPSAVDEILGKIQKRGSLRNGSLIQSMVKVGECQEV